MRGGIEPSPPPAPARRTKWGAGYWGAGSATYP